MKKLLLIMVIMSMVIFTGCSNKMPDDYSNDEMRKGNPFDYRGSDKETTVIGNFGFGPIEALLNEGPVTFDYEGGELVMDYFVDNGMTDDALEYGFFLFLEGIPQPFKVDDPNGEYQFFHAFNLDADEYKEFQFIFTPIFGEAGEALDINVAGIFHPSFAPDSTNTSYGHYHRMSSNIPYRLTFHENTGYIGEDAPQREKILKNISYSEEEISTDMRREYEQGDENRLDQIIFIELYEEGNYVQYNNNQILADGKEAVQLIFRGFGKEGVTYRTTFYLNHRPVDIQDHDYLEWHTIRGSIAEFKMDLDVSQLEGINTLYSISVPIEGEDYILKTESILLMVDN